MGHRHNRRRTRPRSRNRVNRSTSPTGPQPPSTLPSAGFQPPSALTPPAYHIEPIVPIWPSAFDSWQARGYLRRVVAPSVEDDEHYRLFGGEPGDDLSLCYRMLDYFGRLDYIDP